MAEHTYGDVILGYRTAVDDEMLQDWGAIHIDTVIGVLVREHERAELAEKRLRGEAPPPEEKCGARAVGGPCVLPADHNIGHPDVPQAHRTGPAHRNNRAHEIGRELVEIDKAIEHLFIAYGSLTDTRRNAYESDVFTELSNRRTALRRELYEMG